jgi:hypothetical protein
MGAAWLENAPERRVVVWAEQHTGESTARYRALYEVLGQGSSKLELVSSAALGPPAVLSQDSVELVHGGAEWRALLRSKVLSRHELGFAGDFAHAAPFRVGADTIGPFVIYEGQNASAEAIFGHGGRYFRVPSLVNGATWRPDRQAETLPRTGVPRPFVGRSDGTLLIPLELEELALPLPQHESGAQAWLALRPPAEDFR